MHVIGKAAQLLSHPFNLEMPLSVQFIDTTGTTTLPTFIEMHEFNVQLHACGFTNATLTEVNWGLLCVLDCFWECPLQHLRVPKK